MTSEQESLQKPHAPPCTLVIFGASGDLTKRLLLPSIYNLASTRALAEGFRLLGIAREDWDDTHMREHVIDALKKFWGDGADPAVVSWLTQRTFYLKADFDNSSSYSALSDRLKSLEQRDKQSSNRLFYLAVPPSLISVIAAHLSEVKLIQEEAGGCWRRIIVEKPFGEDLSTATKLNADLFQILRDDQIYRIDHFAGKDAVQDLAVFRFSNTIVEPLWHRSLIDSIQITAAETVGVEGRAAYYEKSGALRDMVPNHLAELLSLVAMEPPVSFSAQHMRDKQVELLSAIRKIKAEEVSQYAVRAQYSAGRADNKQLPGYLQEPDVKPDSRTETYVAMKLEIDNWRWSGVPFFLRTGKRLSKALTEIVVNFRRPPTHLFPSAQRRDTSSNQIIFNLQPTQGIRLKIGAKAPGLETTVIEGLMDYKFPDGPFAGHAKGYERLLHDAMLGDFILFQRAEFVEEGWRLVQPLLDAWTNSPVKALPQYAAGSAGPKQADDLLRKSGHSWLSLEGE